MLRSENEIERVVERKTDSADRAFMNGHITRAQYDATMREITAWADAEYAMKRRTA